MKKNKNKNKDLYKRFVTFISGLLLLAMLTGIFAFVWYQKYSEKIVLPYYRRGNWVLIAIYCLIVWLFFRAYGGFKLGYLKQADMFYAQMISMICVNTVSYFLISLIGRHFMAVTPIILMSCVDIAVIAVWTLIAGKVYFMIYPPRKLVIIYGSSRAASLVLKISVRL